ncbi:MAG: M20/M25/M40 family metallo-hydrolase [Chitinophagaceae bacterium]|nr:MAG: M20/M25/M40 family metallo-hydrolase [Chitinophagaceae bacterium]
MDIQDLYTDAVALLKQLIATSSFSQEEDQTASLLTRFLGTNHIAHSRRRNNVWALNQYFDQQKPTILLNSHHDTVKPNTAYTLNPFKPIEENEKLYGLGSNDAGGCVVSLLAAFRYFYEKKDLKYNIAIAITAEEEISGKNGIESILSELPDINFAIVGEPTLTEMAIAEKGLMVLDCTAHGKAGHAAREEGDNAIYKALKDIEWFRNYQFPKISETLGLVKMTVTVIQAGQQHNVVPAACQYTVDIRVTDAYSPEEILDIIKQHVPSEIKPRSLRMRPSSIDKAHPVVQAAIKLGKHLYGSPTTSDQALIPAPSVKIGPGDSARSHSADEFIYLREIKEGIETYVGLLGEIV